MGMRQRYLLGKYNAHRLLKQQDFGFNPNHTNFLNSSFTDLRIQSTGVYRTIQSGYSELLGFDNITKEAYGDSFTKFEMLKSQVDALKNETRGTV